MNHILRRLAATGAAAIVSVGLMAAPGVAQTGTYNVLMFHNAAGFVHPAIPAAIAGFESLALENGFEVTTTDDPTIFTDEGLAPFDVVAFVLTTADAVPDASQREAFERWHAAGGGWLGVHSAADTAYDWEYYGRLLADSYFLNHPLNQPGTAIVEDTTHPATAHLGEQWVFEIEEFYSFQTNPRSKTNVLVSMDESSYEQDPNTTNLPDSPTFPDGVSGVMGDHPMVWCHTVEQGRAFYTAFGHEPYLYGDPDFRAHLLGALETLAGVQDAPCTAAATSGTGDGSDGGGEGATEADNDEAAAASGSLAATGGGGVLLAVGALALARRLRRRD